MRQKFMRPIVPRGGRASATFLSHKLSLRVDSLAEILDGLVIVAILAVIMRGAWLRHTKEIDERFPLRD